MSLDDDYTYVGANGVVIETILSKPLVDVSSVNYKIRKPITGAQVEWACSIDDAPTGTVSYKSTSSDLNEVGVYKTQAFLHYAGGDIIPCRARYFEVKDQYLR